MGLNQTGRSMLSRRARSVPPTYEANRRGQSVAELSPHPGGVDREQVAVDDGVEVADVERPRGTGPEQGTGLLRLVGATASSYASL